MHNEYTRKRDSGISKAYRELLSRLHRAFSAPFSPGEAAEVLGIPARKASRALAHLASAGWLTRVRRGSYITVPLEAANPSAWRKDPWILATALFTPCYVGGWSAAEHLGLTEQIFSDVVVFTASDVRKRHQVVNGSRFLLTSISPDKMFGLESVWRENTKVKVSGAARTIVDVLSRPKLGGGIKHVAEMVEEYLTGEHSDIAALIECVGKLGNRTVCKRMGYVVEALGLETPDLVEFCRSNLSAGYSRLDPSVPRRGKLLRRWNLEVNVELSGEVARA